MNPYDRLDLLETFAKLGESRSLSHVGRQLRMSQSSVSRRLSELEKLVGCQLAIRSAGSRLTFTKEGLALLRESLDLAQRWASLPDRIQGRQGTPQGTLRLIAPAAFNLPPIIDAVADLKARHPQVSVQITEADDVVDLDASGADCWICVGPAPNRGVVWDPIAMMTSRLFAAPSLAAQLELRDLDQVSQAPFVAIQPHLTRIVPMVHASGRRRTILINPEVQTSSLAAGYRAILSGLGIGPATEWMSAADLAAGRLVPVLAGWSVEPVAIQVGVPAHRQNPSRVSALVDALRDRLFREPGFVPPRARQSDCRIGRDRN